MYSNAFNRCNTLIISYYSLLVLPCDCALC